MGYRSLNTQLVSDTTANITTSTNTNSAKCDQIGSLDITMVLTKVTGTVGGTAKLQKNNNPSDATAVWVDLLDGEIQGAATASVTITDGDNTINWSVPDATAREYRAVIGITGGTVTGDVRVHGKSN